MKINVKSEIGKLKSVLVHRPGLEVGRIFPKIAKKLFFDDAMHVKTAQKEHDAFVEKLENEGVKVYYLEKLLAEVFDLSPDIKDKFIEQWIINANIFNKSVSLEVKNYLYSFKNNLDFVNATIAGISKDDISPKFSKNITDLVQRDESYPLYVDPIPTILFQRDPMTSIYNSVNISNVLFSAHTRETLYLYFVYKYHPDFLKNPQLLKRSKKESIEGGDIMILNEKTIFIGLSQRTNSYAVNALFKKLCEQYSEFKNMVAIQIPKKYSTMHLDTVITQVDYNKFLLDANMNKLEYKYYELKRGETTVSTGLIKDILKKYVANDIEIIIVGNNKNLESKVEQWNDGANCLAVSPGKIICYDRNVETNKALKKHGIKVIETPSSELSRGRGGPRCMSMPLERE